MRVDEKWEKKVKKIKKNKCYLQNIIQHNLQKNFFF